MPSGVLESFQKKDALVDLVVLHCGPFYAQNLKQKLGWLATGNQRNQLLQLQKLNLEYPNGSSDFQQNSQF